MCQHATLPLKPATASSKVYKEECTLCFDSYDLPDGIDVCLVCFNGSCSNHSYEHTEKFSHHLVLNIKRKSLVFKVYSKQDQFNPPKKITKLEIQDDSKQYQYTYTVRCNTCKEELPNYNAEANLTVSVDSVINALSAKKQSEMRAWSEEGAKPCAHAENLNQETTMHIEGKALAHCHDCELNNNLWLCLTCGNLGCGRPQYGGLGGNGHGLQHYEATKHPISVKMGSITPEGTADCFCYIHGDEILDPKLGEHLANFGIMVDSQTKTEKSLAELQLEQNLKFDFSMTTDDGQSFEKVYGPGLTGMHNLGNSCYLASVMQVLLAIPQFQERYHEGTKHHMKICKDSPSNCFHCQMGKLFGGVLSGKYSNESGGVTPTMFKDLIGKGHQEFETMRQQDAHEYLQYVFDLVERKEKALGRDPKQRIQCLECERVRYTSSPFTTLSLQVPAVLESEIDGKKIYKQVEFAKCLEKYFDAEIREYSCPHDGQKTTITATQRFKKYPDYLFCAMSRFTLNENWVLEKLNVDISAPQYIDLDQYRGSGKTDYEVDLPEDNQSSEISFDTESLNALLSMGFPEIRCKRALIKTGHAGADAAMNWLFEHMEDPDIDAPLEGTSSNSGFSEEDVKSLMDMGFSSAQAKKALKETGSNMERAVDWLFSHAGDPVSETEEPKTTSIGEYDKKPAKYELFAFICHKGTSSHCGHYVSVIKKPEGWVLFNDNKVALVPDITKLAKEAYIYVFKRL